MRKTAVLIVEKQQFEKKNHLLHHKLNTHSLTSLITARQHDLSGGATQFFLFFFFFFVLLLDRY